ncbi:hypothetical protein ACH5RR_024806 [Cinchona calisaya]|uniref:Uncharacterized protein n=1 Tax=Cinchona calisaya TaxID=153742 RepID=A0ABD2YYW8_9GENT
MDAGLESETESEIVSALKESVAMEWKSTSLFSIFFGFVNLQALYQELSGVKKSTSDKNKILRWPVLLLSAEDFFFMGLTDMFSTHLDTKVLLLCQLPWDNEHTYTRDALELY